MRCRLFGIAERYVSDSGVYEVFGELLAHAEHYSRMKGWESTSHPPATAPHLSRYLSQHLSRHLPRDLVSRHLAIIWLPRWQRTISTPSLGHLAGTESRAESRCKAPS